MRTNPAEAMVAPIARQTAAGTGPTELVTAYTLPPEELQKAVRLAHARALLYFASELWSIAFLLAIVAARGVARLRDTAVSLTRRPWLQGFIFVPSLLVIVAASDLPLAIASHHLSLLYALSVQPWTSWFSDWAKALALTVAGGTLALCALMAVMRKSTRRWWLWAWLITLPLELLLLFAVPYVVDPLFDRFEPLAMTNPALVEQLERVVARSNLKIPTSRMFLMKASEKVTTLNAYVTGFGASKRIVVWDTTIQKCPPDEVLFIFGHEQGHYVLGHVFLGIVAYAIGSLLALWIGYHAVRRLVARYGDRWGVPAVEDWGALAVLLLVFSVLSFAGEPGINAWSRQIEHAADVYGQEVIHGLVTDPRQAAARAFQQLGELSLDDPHPNSFVEFWMDSHPSIAERVAFAARYDPWSEVQRPKYFPGDRH